jgi:hypothetical protein
LVDAGCALLQRRRARLRRGAHGGGEGAHTSEGAWIRDVIKDDFGGKLPSGRPFRPDVRARPRLSRGRVFTVRGRGKNRVRANAEKN